MESPWEPTVPHVVLPPSVKFCTLKGKFLSSVEDSPSDSDVNPDGIPAMGKITFIPTVDHIVSDGVTIKLNPLTVSLDSTGYFELVVIATKGTKPADNWNYNVKYNLNIQLANFTLPPLDPDSITDLSSVSPVVATPGYAVMKGESISAATINGTGHLIITLSSGTQIDAGYVGNNSSGAGISSAKVNTSGHLIITTNSGSNIDAGYVQGRGISSITDVDGDGIATVAYTDGTTSSLPLPSGSGSSSGAGRGVTSITDSDANGIATVAYTDGTTSQLPLPAGQPGPAGKGVSKITSSGNVATVTYTDNTTSTYTLPAGTAGRGITSITNLSGGNTGLITYSDGGTQNLPLPSGPKGDSGRGITSVTNPDGDSTVLVTYTDGTTANLSFSIPPGPSGRGISSITNPDGDNIALVTYTDGTTSNLSLPVNATTGGGGTTTNTEVSTVDFAAVVTN